MSSRERQRHILVVREKEIQERYILEAGMYSIGRDPSCSIVFRSKSISRQHALLLRIPADDGNGYRYRIKDGDSRGRASANGIKVNEQPCREKDLQSGDRIIFGDCIHAQYLIDNVDSLGSHGDTLKVAEFRSVKAKQQDQFPTLMEDELGDTLIASVQEVMIAETTQASGQVIATSPELGQVMVEVLSLEAHRGLKPGDQIRIAAADSGYIFLGKSEATRFNQVAPSEITQGMVLPKPQRVDDLSCPAAADLPPNPANTPSQPDPSPLDSDQESTGILADAASHARTQEQHLTRQQPLELSTLMQDLPAMPSALRSPSLKLTSSKVAAERFRECYLTVLEHFGDLQLSEASHVSIASTIFTKLYA
jgi:pSer/pThr/pTyr-binding forkhead associated (FHA) protein